MLSVCECCIKKRELILHVNDGTMPSPVFLWFLWGVNLKNLDKGEWSLPVLPN